MVDPGVFFPKDSHKMGAPTYVLAKFSPKTACKLHKHPTPYLGSQPPYTIPWIHLGKDTLFDIKIGFSVHFLRKILYFLKINFFLSQSSRITYVTRLRVRTTGRVTPEVTENSRALVTEATPGVSVSSGLHPKNPRPCFLF